MFLEVFLYFKYKFLGLKKILNNKKQLIVGAEIKEGDELNWKKFNNLEVFSWFVENYGKGPFKVIAVEENDCMSRTVYKDGQEKRKVPLSFLIIPKEGKRKGDKVLLGSDLFFEEMLYVYKQWKNSIVVTTGNKLPKIRNTTKKYGKISSEEVAGKIGATKINKFPKFKR